ncbi:hypothetical protein AKO1_008615 [Acrasis kona]|uniref:Uncharacterized protein n=1 Tax=Acrasis kona TaxID=1008807 RepID=A0AAW2YQH2_9EUKA
MLKSILRRNARFPLLNLTKKWFVPTSSIYRKLSTQTFKPENTKNNQNEEQKDTGADEIKKKNDWIILSVMIAFFLSAAQYLTGDHFLSFLLDRIIEKAKLQTCDENDEWDIKYDKVEGCFLCGAMRFTGVKLKRKWVTARGTEKNSLTEHSINIDIESVGMNADMLSLVKSVFVDKKGDIFLSRISIKNLNGQLKTSIKSSVSPNLAVTNHDPPRYDVVVGDLTVLNSDLVVDLEHPNLSKSLHHEIKIKAFSENDFISSSTLFIKPMFGSSMSGLLDGLKFEVLCDGSKTAYKNVRVQLEDYPIQHVVDYYQFLCNSATEEGYSEILPAIQQKNAGIKMLLTEDVVNDVEVINFDVDIKIQDTNKKIQFYIPWDLLYKNGAWSNSENTQVLILFKIIQEMKNSSNN